MTNQMLVKIKCEIFTIVRLSNTAFDSKAKQIITKIPFETSYSSIVEYEQLRYFKSKQEFVMVAIQSS